MTTTPAPTATEVSLRQLGVDATWKVTARPDALVVMPPSGGQVTLEGDALRAAVTMTHALTGKPLLNLRLAEGRVILVMSEHDVGQIARGLGPSAAAATAVTLNANWNLLIGVLISFNAAHAMLAPAAEAEVVSPALEGVRLAVGALAMASGALGRLRPRRHLLLADTVWMAAIVAEAVHHLVAGEGLAWALLVALMTPFAWGRLRLYQLLGPVAR